MTAPNLPEQDDLLAAELALGVLAGAERDAAAARAKAEPAFAAAVIGWRGRFAAMEPGEGVLPPWAAIDARLPANDTGPPTSLRRWRIATVGFAAAAALFLVLLLRPAPAPEAILVATLTGPNQTAAVAVGIDPARGRLVIQPSALGAALAGRVAELWVVPADGRPRSLGLIDPVAAQALSAGDATRGALAPDATLAISLEPAGGSPTGQPTGPVILSGRIARL